MQPVPSVGENTALFIEEIFPVEMQQTLKHACGARQSAYSLPINRGLLFGSFAACCGMAS
jgi:hypothetical protein